VAATSRRSTGTTQKTPGKKKTLASRKGRT
jgi:hypothetical protein